MTTKPGILDLTLYRYSSFVLETLYRDEANALINTTGFKGILECRQDFDNDTEIFKWTNEVSSYITFGGASGAVNINVPPNVTQNYPTGEYYYDFYLKNGSNVVFPYLRGKMSILNSNIRTLITW